MTKKVVRKKIKKKVSSPKKKPIRLSKKEKLKREIAKLQKKVRELKKFTRKKKTIYKKRIVKKRQGKAKKVVSKKVIPKQFPGIHYVPITPKEKKERAIQKKLALEEQARLKKVRREHQRRHAQWRNVHNPRERTAKRDRALQRAVDNANINNPARAIGQMVLNSNIPDYVPFDVYMYDFAEDNGLDVNAVYCDFYGSPKVA